MPHCMNCGQQLVNGAKFCFACGTPAGETARSNQRQQEWAGKIIKCPSCGEGIPSFTANCPACGHELRGTDVTSSVRELASKIEVIEKSRKRQKSDLLKPFYFPVFGRTVTAEDEQKISLISNFPIPNTKEDLYEFLILSKSNIDIDAYDDGGNEFKKNSAEVKVSNAWRAKFEQAYQKAKIVFADDSKLQDIHAMYEATQKSISKAKWQSWKLLGIGFGVLMIMFVFLMGMLNADDRRNDRKINAENERLEAIVAEVYDALEDENYTLARAKAASLTFSGPNTPEADNASEKWDKTRTELLAIIDAASEGDSDETYEMDDSSNSSSAENNSASSNNTDIPNDFTIGYEKAEFSRFNSSAAGNELGGSRIYFYCVLDKTEILEASDTTSILGYVTDSSNNEWLIQLHFVPAVSKTAFDSYVGEELVLRGVYSGFSGTKEMPVVVLDEMIVLSTGENVMGMQKLLDE